MTLLVAYFRLSLTLMRFFTSARRRCACRYGITERHARDNNRYQTVIIEYPFDVAIARLSFAVSRC